MEIEVVEKINKRGRLIKGVRNGKKVIKFYIFIIDQLQLNI